MSENGGMLVNRYLVVAYFIEVGVILVVVPWSGFWDRNYFTQALPALDGVIRSSAIRGAVSGIGLINIAAGIADLVSIISTRRH